MSNAPYLSAKARAGARIGHQNLVDHMFLDGLEDVYEKGTLMGVFAERTAKLYGFTREEQDDFAIRSLNRAKNAIEDGSFKEEITPVSFNGRNGKKIVENFWNESGL